jgi:hypothetical protein
MGGFWLVSSGQLIEGNSDFSSGKQDKAYEYQYSEEGK